MGRGSPLGALWECCEGDSDSVSGVCSDSAERSLCAAPDLPDSFAQFAELPDRGSDPDLCEYCEGVSAAYSSVSCGASSGREGAARLGLIRYRGLRERPLPWPDAGSARMYP